MFLKVWCMFFLPLTCLHTRTELLTCFFFHISQLRLPGLPLASLLQSKPSKTQIAKPTWGLKVKVHIAHAFVDTIN